MNLNNKCPDCGDLLKVNIKRCICGWGFKEEKNKSVVDYQCSSITEGTPCKKVGVIFFKNTGNAWYCRMHAASVVEPRQKTVSPLLLEMGIK